nr:zinc finger BED domain-containing protein 1-like [Onthophagus taurus]
MASSKKRSAVWDYFKKDSVSAVTCEICKKQFKFSGNTSNIRDHLRRKHPGYFEIDKLNKQDEFQQFGDRHNNEPSTSTQDQQLPSTLMQSQLQEQSSKSTSTIDSINCKKRSRQMKLCVTNKKTELSEIENDQIDQSLIKMIVIDYQPLSIVENPGFLEYSKKLQPLYKPPTRKLLSSKILPNTYNQICEKVKILLAKVDHVAVTTDIWTSDSNKAYLTVTSHFFYDDFIHNAVLATKEIPEAHTGVNIASALSEIFNVWEIDYKIISIVSDNGANIKNAIIGQLQKEHHPCIAHTLNLCVTDALKSTEPVMRLIKKCRALVAHFKHSTVACEKLKSMQKQMLYPELKVKQDVSTRWNSTLIMAERLLAIKDPLSAAITSLPRAPEFITATEWDLLIDVVSILKPFEKITIELSGEKYITMSLIIPLIRCLQHSLKSRIPKTTSAESLKLVLQDNVRTRLGILETNLLCSKATFLDPRFKKAAFSVAENGDIVQKLIIEEISSILQNKGETIEKQTIETTTDNTDDKENIWSHFDQEIVTLKSISTPCTTAALMVTQYLEISLVARTQNPIEFWKRYKSVLPEIYQLHKRYSCIPATSVPSERVFSKAGQIINERRNRLSGKNLDMIIFLNSNINLFN